MLRDFFTCFGILNESQMFRNYSFFFDARVNQTVCTKTLFENTLTTLSRVVEKFLSTIL